MANAFFLCLEPFRRQPYTVIDFFLVEKFRTTLPLMHLREPGCGDWSQLCSRLCSYFAKEMKIVTQLTGIGSMVD